MITVLFLPSKAVYAHQFNYSTCNADKLKISLMIIHINSEIKPTGENRMSHEDYMLILGTNVYANPEYTVSYEVDKDTRDRINFFTLENRENGLILTTEILDEHANLIAKILKMSLFRFTRNLMYREKSRKDQASC